MSKRQDFDPANQYSFLKTQEKIKKKPKKKFNKYTNWFDYIRVANKEADDPVARGYIDIPQLAGRPTFVEDENKRTLEQARIRELALRTKIPIPVLDAFGNIVYQTNNLPQTREMMFREIETADSLTKLFALKYLSHTQPQLVSDSSVYAYILKQLSQNVPVQTLNSIQQGQPITLPVQTTPLAEDRLSDQKPITSTLRQKTKRPEEDILPDDDMYDEEKIKEDELLLDDIPNQRYDIRNFLDEKEEEKEEQITPYRLYDAPLNPTIKMKPKEIKTEEPKMERPVPQKRLKRLIKEQTMRTTWNNPFDTWIPIQETENIPDLETEEPQQLNQVDEEDDMGIMPQKRRLDTDEIKEFLDSQAQTSNNKVYKKFDVTNNNPISQYNRPLDTFYASILLHAYTDRLENNYKFAAVSFQRTNTQLKGIKSERTKYARYSNQKYNVVLHCLAQGYTNDYPTESLTNVLKQEIKDPNRIIIFIAAYGAIEHVAKALFDSGIYNESKNRFIGWMVDGEFWNLDISMIKLAENIHIKKIINIGNDNNSGLWQEPKYDNAKNVVYAKFQQRSSTAQVLADLAENIENIEFVKKPIRFEKN